jgi:hypothetical protein
MVAVVPEESVDAGIRLLAEQGVLAWVCGSAAPSGSGTRAPVTLFGEYPHE